MQENNPEQDYCAPVVNVAQHPAEQQAVLQVQYRIIGVFR